MIDYKCSYSIHVSRKELYLQLIAYSPVSWRRGRFKDRWEDGNGTGPNRSTPANLTIRLGRVSPSGETTPVSGLNQCGMGVTQNQRSGETKVTTGPAI